MGRQSVILYAAGDRRHDDSGTMAITYVVLNNQHRADASLLGAAHRFKIRIEYVSAVCGVDVVIIHERDRKGSIQTTQEVEIYFNFVGRFVPPAFGEVELTPEELEEIRKREERKDRLHQNYLKRKANGKQKEYEERTKAKKKAEIEARKQAIRTEDIARGVFIPVSSLPQLGPRKGA